MVFTDDFNRADSTDLGSNWTEVVENWSIVSNQLAPANNGTPSQICLCTQPTTTRDNSVEVTYAVFGSASMGVFCRSNAIANTYYLWRNNGTGWALFRNQGGSFTQIGFAAGVVVNGDIVKIQAIGSTIKGFVNGVELVSVIDTTITTGNYGGVRANGSATLRYDNFTIRDHAPDEGGFFPFI
jgi:hypothetical protein